ncbi:hypothetical protein [Sphingobacterium bambusae]|uniref:ABC transporter permease n=1 Tax=Sphingobacterium bambusae TaxID=662858 RepID=A0ABW6BP45_9SPHI|nr:hypothetical protein [Sphingobacterium bambusae]WPL48194.1 hypothetical protein SCB77_19760 [Sphingobacterium bambusae]
MSNTFQTNRFFALVTRQWISFGKIYLMSIGIAAGVIAAFYGYALYEFRIAVDYIPSGLLDFRMPLFILLGLFFVTIISASYFSDYGQKSKAIFELLIPASRLEKFLTAMLYSVVVCMLSFIAVFWLIDLAFVSYLRNQATSSAMIHADEIKNIDHSLAYITAHYRHQERVRYLFFLPFLLNAIFLLGSIAYRNFHYVKTAVVLIAYIAIWSLGTVYIMKALTDGSVTVRQSAFFENEDNPLQLCLLVGILVTLILWGIAFLRLKEKEV